MNTAKMTNKDMRQAPDPRGIAINPRTIAKLYGKCQWRRGDLDNMRMNVTAVIGKMYAIHRRRLSEQTAAIGSILMRCMPERLMKSHTAAGVPWHAFMFDKEGIPVGSEEDVDMLLAVASACGFVSLNECKVDGVIGTVTFAAIEDRTINFYRRRDESLRITNHRKKKNKT